MVLELRAGGSTAWIHPDHGGRLGQLDLGGGPLLRGPEDGVGWANWGAYPLAPWSNRLPGGTLSIGTERYELQPNWADGSAIHGLVAAVAWEVVQAGVRSAQLRIEVDVAPYRIAVRQRFELSAGTLLVTLGLRNDGDRVVPAGLGLHPWFRAGAIVVPAASYWPGEPLPTGAPIVAAGADDLRTARVPSTMDRCYTALDGTAVRVPGVELAWEGPITQVVVCTIEPGWVAVEPVTMANDGFRMLDRPDLPHGVRRLGPGAEIEVTYRFRATP